MATRKFRKFSEGGEAADKEAGLKSSKDEKVGFFERLRMGNIDDEGSEAYRRFGAGRGKAERTPVEKMEPSFVRQSVAPASEDMSSMLAAGAEAGKRQPSGDASVAEMYQGPRTKPIVTSSPASSKPSSTKSAPVKSSSGKSSAYPMTGAQPTTKTYDRSGGPTADELANYKPPAKNQNLSSQIPGESNAKPVAGEKTEKMSDSERNISNILAATGGAGIGTLRLYKAKKALDARKAAAQGAKKRDNLKRDVEEGIDRNLADEFKGYSSSAAEKAIAAKQSAADRTRDLAAGQAKTKFTSESKKPSKKTKKFDDSESNIEFKRGGSTAKSSKPAAKGWGMARGARAAKMR